MRSAHWLALVVALSSSGCVHFVTHVPVGFVELPRGQREGFAFRAVTPDGLVLAVRDVENPDIDGKPNGDTAFWVKAISNRLRDTGGYALLEQKDVTTKAGNKGVLLSYGHDEGRSPHRYQVALFQARDRLLVVEAGGEKALFEAQAASVAQFLNDFEVK
jgi:hypothetical protein